MEVGAGGGWAAGGKRAVIFDLDGTLGDTPSDVVSARRAGLRPVAVGWARGADVEALRRERPDVFFDRVEELRDWLLGPWPPPGSG